MARRPPLDQLEPQRICFIKPSALGDVVQALPILSALRSRWPHAHISWVINHSLADLLTGHPDLDEVIPFYRHGRTFQKLRAMRQLARRLRQGKFDLAIDQQGLLRSALMIWATRATRRVGFAHAREGATLAYTDRVHVRGRWQEISAVLCNWQLAQALGCAGAPPRPRLGWTEEHHRWVREQIAHLPRPLLMLHPGAQWQTKRWPAEHFAELAHRAQNAFAASVVLVGGRGEGSLCEAIAQRLDPAKTINLAERTPLLYLAALLAQGNVYLSGDSGPMHLAAAVGTPVVAVFTCTSPVRSGPYGDGHRAVATCVSCAASYVKKCASLRCMSELTPARVWPYLQAAIQQSLLPNAAGNG